MISYGVSHDFPLQKPHSDATIFPFTRHDVPIFPWIFHGKLPAAFPWPPSSDDLKAGIHVHVGDRLRDNGPRPEGVQVTSIPQIWDLISWDLMGISGEFNGISWGLSMGFNGM